MIIVYLYGFTLLVLKKENYKNCDLVLPVKIYDQLEYCLEMGR